MRKRFVSYKKRLQLATDELTDWDITEGKLAYIRYNYVMEAIADKYSIGIVPTVEAFAALSPNNDYKGNLRSLVTLLEYVTTDRPDWTVSTYRACGERALSYLYGAVSFVDTVKGLKTRAFRNNLLYPMWSKDVTVDGHIAIIAKDLGDKATMKDALLSNSEYRNAEEAIQKICMNDPRFDLPHQLQAALWLFRKRSLAIKMSTQEDFFRDASETQIAVEDILPFTQKELVSHEHPYHEPDVQQDFGPDFC